MGSAGQLRVHRQTARAEGEALYLLAQEVRDELSDPEPDEDMVLPLCKELQAKAQKLANHIEQLVDARQRGV